MITYRLISAVTIAIAVIAFTTTSACDSESSYQERNDTEATAISTDQASPDIAVLAHRLVFAYMSDKPWGFFGATCEKWIEGDYLWDSSMSESQPDGRIKITYQRKEDRIVGPEKLVFHVNIDSGDVEGDNKPETDTGRMGVAEGCDQW